MAEIERRAVRARRPPPYVGRMGRSGSLTIWLVDGSHVRAAIDPDFATFGHHYSHLAIPRDEIWMDAELLSEAHEPLVRRAVIERRLMARGMDYEAARTVAIAEEKKGREREYRSRRQPSN